MARKVLGSYVHVTNKKGEAVVLSPGQELPGWAKDIVTNPKAFRDEETVESQSESGGSESTSEAASYAALDLSGLKAELKKRELPQTGNKAELIERLEKHDAELKAAEGGSGDGDGDGDTGDGADSEE